MRIQANGIAIEVEDSGADGSQAGRPAVLLIMGLGLQLVSWPQDFLGALLQAGYRVVRFDNRDVGLSERFDHLGVPNLMWEGLKHRVGLPVQAPYGVRDMAADALGVLDALRIPQAHVIGVSMGGMIAQRVALAAPERVLSLTSIMSSSGARYLPGPRPQVLQALLSRPRGSGEAAVVEHYLEFFKLIGSPGFAQDEAALRQRIVDSVQRSYHPAGTARQIAAVAADTRRADELRDLRRPTLVIHGTDDPLVPFACGQDIVRRVPRAQLVGIRGMGHDLPPGVVECLMRPLLPHLQLASAR